jgi:hypothetical protein
VLKSPLYSILNKKKILVSTVLDSQTSPKSFIYSMDVHKVLYAIIKSGCLKFVRKKLKLIYFYACMNACMLDAKQAIQASASESSTKDIYGYTVYTHVVWMHATFF